MRCSTGRPVSQAQAIDEICAEPVALSDAADPESAGLEEPPPQAAGRVVLEHLAEPIRLEYFPNPCHDDRLIEVPPTPFECPSHARCQNIDWSETNRYLNMCSEVCRSWWVRLTEESRSSIKLRRLVTVQGTDVKPSWGGVATVSQAKPWWTAVKVAHWVGEDEITTLAKACGLGLTSLDLYQNPHITDETVKEIAEHCSALVTLNIGHCYHLTDTALIRIGKGCTSLTAINITGCSEFSQPALTKLKRRLPSLKIANYPAEHRAEKYKEVWQFLLSIKNG